VVEAPDVYERHLGIWDGANSVDMAPARRAVVHTWRKARFSPEQLLVEPANWATIDYTSVVNTSVAGTIEWIVGRPGTGHGLSVWFDALLAPGVIMSNAPTDPPLLYGSEFFPWPAPLALAAGGCGGVPL